MNKQKNIFFIFASLALWSIDISSYTEPIQLQRPTNFQIPENTKMPSVEDLFGNMSEEQIIQQIQEAQKLFDSLSPEEMEEFAKIVDQTYAQMSDKDRKDIEGIASMVKPYFPEEQTTSTMPKTSSEEFVTKKARVDDSINTNSIQSLIDNINQQIDSVLQKASSNKDLAEAFTTHWTSKISLDNMKRQILTLKQDRLAKKLTKKEQQEEKDLVQKLEEFHKELKNKNSNFNVEDEFGLSSSNKKQNAQQLQQAKEILAFFDSSIDTIIPILEKFLKKHDPEAIELAKEASEREKRAKDVAKDASIKRGSPAAIASPDSSRKKAQPAVSNKGPESYPNYYDPYAPYYGDNYNPQSYNAGAGSPTSSESDKPKTKEEKKSDKDKDKDKDGKEKDKDKDNKASFTPYDKAVDSLDDYFSSFDQDANTNMIKFLQSDLPSYPDATNSVGSPNPKVGTEGGNQEKRRAWLYSADPFIDKGFTAYTTKINKDLARYIHNLQVIKKTLETVKENIPFMPEADLKKLGTDKKIQQLKNRITEYQNSFNSASDAIKAQFELNINAWRTFLTGDEEETYTRLHSQFKQNLDNFNSILTEAAEEMRSIPGKIKRYQIKNKSKK